MKHLAIALCCFVSISLMNQVNAQSNITNDYLITSSGDVSNITPYTEALDAANWETYRLQNQRYQLSFDNGIIIELRSATEMVELGYPLNISSYRLSNPEGFIPPILKLLAGNVIGMEVQNSPYTKYH